MFYSALLSNARCPPDFSLLPRKSLKRGEQGWSCLQVQDAAANHVPHVLVIPCLFVTLMLGPAGLMSYFVVRTLVGLIRRNERSIKNE